MENFTQISWLNCSDIFLLLMRHESSPYLINLKTKNFMNSKLIALTIASFLLLTNQIYAQNIKEYTPLDPSTLNSADFGQGTALGFSIFNGVGFVVRHNFDNEDQLGLVTNFALVINSTNTSNMQTVDVNAGISLLPEYNFYLSNTYKEKSKRNQVKRKYKKHFISLKAGTILSRSNVYRGVISWHRESFLVRNKSHARGLDLGLVLTYFPDGNGGLFGGSTAVAGVFFRLDWTWSRKGKN